VTKQAKTLAQAIAFVKREGIVTQSARSNVPSFAEWVAGEPIRGGWWAHPAGKLIFRLSEAIAEHPDVLTCTLVDGKVTYVHKRLWPALVKLADRFPKARLAKSWQEHTASGAHQKRRVRFPKWVKREVVDAASHMSPDEAAEQLADILPPVAKPRPSGVSRRTRSR
jgi:hypothetical protein